MPSSTSRSALLAVCLSSCLAPAAWAQVPAGAEFRINSYTTADQALPAVITRADGSYLVVWQSVSIAPVGQQLMGRVLEADGTPRGADFTISPDGTSLQFEGQVAADAKGNFVVAWANFGLGANDLFARRFTAAGAPSGAAFRVNSYTTGTQYEAGVAMAPGGAFVVVWSNPSGQDGDGFGVFGQRYDAAGQPVAAEFQVNTITVGQQRRSSVAYEANGGFVVVWDGPDDLAQGIWARRYDAAGSPLGAEQQVNLPLASQSQADVATPPQGGFVVAWTSYAQDGSHNGVFGRRFDAAGAPVGGEFRANTHTTNSQGAPRLAVDAAGNFVIVWNSFLQDGSDSGVFGQRYDATAVRRGGEFAVNTYTSFGQDRSVVASDPLGNFLAVWQSNIQDGFNNGIFSKRYGGLRPASLAVLDLGNNVLEVNDTFTLTTAWRNFSGGSRTVQGGATQITAPAGLSLGFTTAAANYDTIPNGADGPCIGPCYAGTLTGTRPPGHVDARFRETLVPDTQGQVKDWRLHVGRSFSDVNSAGVFYRFVETLFHHGVTGGCTASTYCPITTTTRQEMAVFMLVAKEGAGYAPPACTAPPFPDVPSGSGFCPFIAELSRRGVVAGCGGGNYCPGNPVLRQEMAVFALATLDPTFTPPPCTAPPFADVPTGNPFCPHIAELAARGVVSGCGGGNYCPATAVTRQEMAVFISGTFGLLLYGP